MMRSNRPSSRLRLALAATLVALVAGCDHVASALPKSTWHEKCGWQAEDYFDDPQVIALCEAIEASDLEEMERLVAAGADINALGKGNMTPLLWSYPDNKPERFAKCLELGADPNVIFQENFNADGRVTFRGTSVTHLACATWFPKYFDLVFDHGGDPNLLSNTPLGGNEPPLISVMKGPVEGDNSKVARLIQLGADLDHMSDHDQTAAGYAAARGRLDITLQLLEAGADYQVYRPRSNLQLVHTLLSLERRLDGYTPDQRAGHSAALKWLEQHGVSIDAARADLERWSSWKLPGEYGKKMAIEVAARRAREAAEKAAAQD